jgi:hypothetical protein
MWLEHFRLPEVVLLISVVWKWRFLEHNQYKSGFLCNSHRNSKASFCLKLCSLLLLVHISIVLRCKWVRIIGDNLRTRILLVAAALSDNRSHMAGAGSSRSCNCRIHGTALARISCNKYTRTKFKFLPHSQRSSCPLETRVG